MKTSKKFVQTLKRHNYFLRNIKQKLARQDVSKTIKNSITLSPHSYVTRLNIQNTPVALCKTKSFNIHRSRPTEKLKFEDVLNKFHQGRFPHSTKVNDFQGFQVPIICASVNKEPIDNRANKPRFVTHLRFLKLKRKVPRYVTRLQVLKLKDKFPFLKKRITDAFKVDKLSQWKNNRRSLLRRRYLTRQWVRNYNLFRCNDGRQKTSSLVPGNENHTTEYLSNLRINKTKPEVSKEYNLIKNDNEDAVAKDDNKSPQTKINNDKMNSEFIHSNIEQIQKVLQKSSDLAGILCGTTNTSEAHSQVIFPDPQNLKTSQINLYPIINDEKIRNQLKKSNMIYFIKGNENIVNVVNESQPDSNFGKKYSNVDSEYFSDDQIPESKRTTESFSVGNEKEIPKCQKSHFYFNQVDDRTNLNTTAKDAQRKNQANDEDNADETVLSFQTTTDMNSSESTECAEVNNSEQLTKLISENNIVLNVYHSKEYFDAIKRSEHLGIDLTISTLTEQSFKRPHTSSPTSADRDANENLKNAITDEATDEERSTTPKLQSLPEDSLNELMEDFRNGGDISYYQSYQELLLNLNPNSPNSSNSESEDLTTPERSPTPIHASTNTSMEI